MPTTSMTHDHSKRYQQREWKKYSPHIPKHSSLPVLRLVPSDRPLFVCENCLSSNIYLPLCLWCRWTSDSAISAFENATPRPRTISAPKFSSDLIQRKRPDRRRHAGIIVTPPRVSFDSNESTEPPYTPSITSELIGLGGIAGVLESCSYDQIEDMLKEDLAPSSVPDHHLSSRHLCDLPSLRPSDTASTIRMSTDTCNNSSRNGYKDESGARPLKSASNAEHSSLHRRGPLMQWTGRDSASDRDSIMTEPVWSTRARISTEMHSIQRPMSTPPPSSYRPRRPLYHYIRNTSSPPSHPSPFDIHDSHLRQETRSQDQPRVALEDNTSALVNLFQQSPPIHDFDFAIHTRHALTHSTKGFSMSGEMEQRMELARISAGGSDYKFHKVRKRDCISSKVKEITRNLRDLFKKRGSR